MGERDARKRKKGGAIIDGNQRVEGGNSVGKEMRRRKGKEL